MAPVQQNEIERCKNMRNLKWLAFFMRFMLLFKLKRLITCMDPPIECRKIAQQKPGLTLFCWKDDTAHTHTQMLTSIHLIAFGVAYFFALLYTKQNHFCTEIDIVAI